MPRKYIIDSCDSRAIKIKYLSNVNWSKKTNSQRKCYTLSFSFYANDIEPIIYWHKSNMGLTQVVQCQKVTTAECQSGKKINTQNVKWIKEEEEKTEEFPKK